MDSEKCNKTVDVPYVAFESVIARWERANKRLIVIIGILIGLLFASNLAWLIFMYGADFESYDAEADSQGGNLNYNFVGDTMEGDISYGASESESAEDNPQEREREDSENTGENR